MPAGVRQFRIGKQHDFEPRFSRPGPPQRPLRLGDGRRDLFRRPRQRRYGRRTRRLHRSAAAGIRLEYRRDFISAVDPLHPVRVDGAVRGRPAEPLWLAQRDASRTADRHIGASRLACDEPRLAADAALGRGDRHRHWHDRAGIGSHDCSALVFRPAWARRRHSHRERGHRATGVSAAPRQHHRTVGLASSVGDGVCDTRDGRILRAAVNARPSERPRSAPVRRRGYRAGAGATAEQGADRSGGARHPARLLKIGGVLGAVCDVLYLRGQHQRACAGAPDSDVPRFRHPAGSSGELACRHGRVRFLRHHRLGLALGPL